MAPSPSARARGLGLSALAVIAAVSCATRPRDGEATHEGERTSRATQALTATQLFGTSLGAKQLSLTFDDGPGTRTAELSTYLKAQGIKATFFINGGRVAATGLPNPNGVTPTPNAAAILAQIQADGHLLANHTTTHRDVTSVPAGQLVQELSETDAFVAPRVPPNRFLFRAPFGSWNAAAYNTLHASAMDKYVGPIYWEAGGISDDYPNAAADWACWQGQLKNTNGTPANGTGYATTAQCGDAYIAEIAAFGKGIVLMHDPYGYAQGHTVDMVKYMVPLLKAAGYTFVRLDQVPAIAAQLPCDATCATCNGPESNQCATCGAGRYLSAGECKVCSTCPAGSYETAACAADADTMCAPCTVCGAAQYQVSACGAAVDRVCAACDATCATCNGAGPDACGACPAGAYLDGARCPACAVCAAGSFASAACTPTTNTVCTPCAAGTFSGAPGATTCTPCPAGTTSAAGATACTAPPDAGAGDASAPDAASPADAGGPTPDGSTTSPGADAGRPFDDVDGNGITPGDGGGSTSGGCASAPGRAGEPGVATLALALAAVASRRRRRARAR